MLHKDFFWLFLICLSLSSPVWGQGDAAHRKEYEAQYQERITRSYLNGRYIPKDIDDAMLQLDQLIDEPSKKKYKSVPEETAVSRIHFTFGRWMILNWGFYEGSRLSHYLKSKGITYPDDMAAALMTWYHRRLNAKPLEIDELANFYAETRKKEVRERLLEGEIIQPPDTAKKQ